MIEEEVNEFSKAVPRSRKDTKKGNLTSKLVNEGLITPDYLNKIRDNLYVTKKEENGKLY